MTDPVVRPGPRTDERSSPFEVFARLYAVARPTLETTVIEANEGWGADSIPRSLDGPTIWGRLPMRGPGRLERFLTRAMKRERALAEIRRRHERHLREVHRLRPSASTQGGPVRPWLRRTLRSGLLVELSDQDHERVIDRVLREARAPAQTPVVLPRADGAALAMLHLADQSDAVLRVMPVADSTYPGNNADALVALERAGVAEVPRLVARSTTCGASWSVESRRPGTRPSRLDRDLIDQISGLLAHLPQQPRATMLQDRMRAVADRFPRWATLLGQLGKMPIDAPSILQHGDLWRGNILVVDGRLSGVIDWDTWHPAGIPGVDLLQLMVMERRNRTGESIGSLWRSAPWRSPEFLEAGRRYFAALRVEVTPQLIDVIGLAWWASQVLRHDHQAGRPAWVQENVDEVLAGIGGSS